MPEQLLTRTNYTPLQILAWTLRGVCDHFQSQLTDYRCEVCYQAKHHHDNPPAQVYFDQAQRVLDELTAQGLTITSEMEAIEATSAANVPVAMARDEER